MKITVEEIIDALERVIHPALGKNVVELGMVGDVDVDANEVSLTLTFAKSADPMKNSMVKACEKALQNYLHPDVVAKINVATAHRQPLTTVERKSLKAKNVIAVASGKGGVGKSTVAANIAVALAKLGNNVGLLDADIYGPSIPKMFGVEGVRPELTGEDGQEIIIPVERFGVRMLSIGFFTRPQDAMIWRGPMASSVIKQLLNQSDWGAPDYLIVDLPPGTGDVHLTIVQELAVTGALIVSTPQKVALADVVKGINMFQTPKVNVPILGIVENMAWFTPEELPDNRYYIFGNGGCKALAEQEGIKLLGQIPLVQGICESSDNGQPVAENENSITGRAFIELAKRLIDATNERNENQPPTKRVEIG